MGYNSLSFNPSSIATASDAASAASVLASDASSAASNAISAASDALSKITARSTAWDNKTVILKVLPDDSTVADDDGIQFTIPNTLSGTNLVSCGAHVYTAPTSDVMQIYISNVTQTAQMLTSVMTIDTNETDTATAASQAVIDTGNDDVAVADVLKIYASEAGSGASGLEFRLTFKKP
jgi:hypothetical protein